VKPWKWFRLTCLTERLPAQIFVVFAIAIGPALVLDRLVAQQCPGVTGQVFARKATTPFSAGDSQVSAPSAAVLAGIAIDYPEEGSVFPPDFASPTFLWRDSAADARLWRIYVAFTDGGPGIEVTSPGERLRVGEIDQRCVSLTNELPKLTDQQAVAHTWTPDAATWEAIKKHSTEHPATVTITGFRRANLEEAVSVGRVVIKTSQDPVGAPIFYRDVPLMPSEIQKGVIKPLAPAAMPLIAWRLRNVSEARSRLLLDGMHTCANCHSFSSDGKTLGMDLDGPQNDKGLYAIAPVKPQMSIRTEDVISWSSLRDETVAKERIGFMSQVSPDGRYVITMIRGLQREITSGYYVVNFKDYRFLQVFYPTRGIVAWYNRTTGQMHALPGADDPRYVQTDPVWSPDGKYVVYARAEAKEPYSEGQKLPEQANDPDETQVQYDLYRIPFNEGKGSQAEPIMGASRNGMSNTFPKVSPDGRWIVFVKCRNGQLMRPDSQLYIVPAEGGQPRKMRCNTPLMNSWHSFSPNGRWLVFSSKSRSPYTQMFLTHLDEHGNDSPPILIENATAANRAVNIPEFVNIPADGLMKIEVPAAESYRLFDSALDLTNRGQIEAAIAEWQKVLDLDPRNANAQSNLGFALIRQGNLEEGIKHFQRAVEINPDYSDGHNNLALALLRKGSLDEALPYFQRALELNFEYAGNYEALVSPFKSAATASLDIWLANEIRRSISRVEALKNPWKSGPASEKPLEEWPNRPNARGVQGNVLQVPDFSGNVGWTNTERTEIGKLIAHLEIPRLRKLAEQKNTDEGVAAQRETLLIFLHTFEAGTQFLEQKRAAQALVCLDIAAQAAPNNAYILYDLARALALNNQKKKALQILERAAEKGFNNSYQLEGDRAFVGLRDDSGYRRTLAEMRAGKPEPK
jgi:tetratricopeptide (TPR) repeat protein